jgi:hypothetical protein
VFIHRDSCPSYDGEDFPEELRSIPLVIESYDARGTLLEQHRPGETPIDQVLDERVADCRVDYLHLRNAEAGCFIARVQPVVSGD